MRILLLNDSLHLPDIYAGTALNTHYLAKHLIQRGHFVAVAARRRIEAEMVEHADCGYPVFVGPKLGDVLKRLSRLTRFDVAVNQNRGLWQQVDPFYIGEGPLPVFYEHTLLTKARKPTPEIRSRGLCLVNSFFLAYHYAKFYGVGSVVVPPLYGVDRYATLQHEPRHATIVSLQWEKGADIALQLARLRPDIEFVFVASWNERTQDIVELRDRAGLPANVRVLENRPDLGDVLAGTRLLLMPSRVPETWGRVATECQSLGIPVLGSDRGNLPSTIGAGGIALDPDADIARWQEAFARLWDDEREYRRIGIEARRHAQAFLADMNAATDRFEFVLRSAVPTLWPQNGRTIGVRRAPVRVHATRPSRADVRLPRQSAVNAVASASVETFAVLARRFAGTTNEATARAMALATGLPLRPACMILARRKAVNEAEAILQRYKGLMRNGWRQPIGIVGRRFLKEARAAGRGAILLQCPTVFGASIVKMGLQAAGFQTHLLYQTGSGDLPERPDRPRVDDPGSEFEDRFLASRLQVDWSRPVAAMIDVRAALQRNELILVDPLSPVSGPAIEQPFLNRHLRLSVGPLRLARLTGAPLLPVSALRLADSDKYETRIRSPLEWPDGGSAEAAWRSLAAQFVAYLAQDAIRAPSQWLGWDALVP